MRFESGILSKVSSMELFPSLSIYWMYGIQAGIDLNIFKWRFYVYLTKK